MEREKLLNKIIELIFTSKLTFIEVFGVLKLVEIELTENIKEVSKDDRPTKTS